MSDRDQVEGWGVRGDWRQYFSDPAQQTLADMVVDLMAATWTLIDRQRVLEFILESRALIRPGEIDAFQPTVDQERQLTSERDSLIAQVLDGITRARQTGPV